MGVWRGGGVGCTDHMTLAQSDFDCLRKSNKVRNEERTELRSRKVELRQQLTSRPLSHFHEKKESKRTGRH